MPSPLRPSSFHVCGVCVNVFVNKLVNGVFFCQFSFVGFVSILCVEIVRFKWMCEEVSCGP